MTITKRDPAKASFNPFESFASRFDTKPRLEAKPSNFSAAVAAWLHASSEVKPETAGPAQQEINHHFELDDTKRGASLLSSTRHYIKERSMAVLDAAVGLGMRALEAIMRSKRLTRS